MAAKKTTKPTTPEYETCPCCKQKTLKKPIKISSEIAEHYMACIVSGVPFNHTFPMYDGRLVIKVLSHSREETILVYKMVMLTEPLAHTSPMLKDLIGLVNSYGNIESIAVKHKDDEGKEHVTVYKPSSYVLKACAELVAKWETVKITDDNKKEFLADMQEKYNKLSSTEIISAIPPVVLHRVVSDFRMLDSILLEAGFDENFWKGIELA